MSIEYFYWQQKIWTVYQSSPAANHWNGKFIGNILGHSKHPWKGERADKNQVVRTRTALAIPVAETIYTEDLGWKVCIPIIFLSLCQSVYNSSPRKNSSSIGHTSITCFGKVGTSVKVLPRWNSIDKRYNFKIKSGYYCKHT